MTFYEPSNHRQQVEILRRFSSDVLHDTNHESYAPYERTEEIEDALMHLFFTHRGITEIALYYGCPEPVIMDKILSMGLYSHYDELLQQLQDKYRAQYPEPCDQLFLPRNQHDRDVEALRRSTSMFPCDQFEWTDEKSYMVFWLFRMGEDITDIALRLKCPEWMVVQKFMDDRLYGPWTTPWFRYSNQESRDNYLNGYLF